LALNAQTEQRDDAPNTLMAESQRAKWRELPKNRELSSAYSAVITRGAQFTYRVWRSDANIMYFSDLFLAQEGSQAASEVIAEPTT